MKLIFDTVYGYIPYSEIETKFLDTSWVKRLKRVKQLGLLDHVFPSASHSRFEHSIGVSYLAEKYNEFLIRNSRNIDCSSDMKFCIKMAGLLHDVGHGPFSHVFDNIVISNHAKKHEDRSRDIVEYIFKEIGTSCGFTNAYNIDTIKEMIEPKTDTYLKNPLYNLVNNSVNSIDVDKLDYLQRDPRHIGLDYAFDPWRILNKSYIKENNVIYSKSLVSNILEMFRTRYRFHKDIYNHKTVKLIEVMIGDALKNADNHYGFSSMGTEELIQYDDSIYNQILFSKNKDLEKSKNILERIEKRNLYKLVGWSEHSTDESELNDLYEDKFPDYCKTDLRSINMKFNFCNGTSSPLNRVKFDIDGCIKSGEELYTDKLMPSVYEEKTIMIYSTK